MQLIKELIVIDKASKTPIYLQITQAVIQSIRQGKLRKGLRLPGARRLAELLEINRLTVVAAFRELESQGWLDVLPQKGAVVKVDLPLLMPRKLKEEAVIFKLPEKPGFAYEEKKVLPYYSPEFPPPGKLVLDDGFPDTRLAPIEDLVRCIRSFSRLSFNKKYLTYGGSQGTLYLRDTLATFLNDTRGLSITPANVLITKGAQMGLYLASTLLIRPNQEVIVGTPGYARANHTFQLAGARISYIPMDEMGIDPGRVEKICKTKTVRMVYVIPHHHHPTTVTLSSERRLHLLELAAKYKFAIIEDDYDYDFHYGGKPMMPMASLDRDGNVIYVGTLSKSLAPAIRVGFMIAPERLIRSATSLRKAIDSQGDSLIENAIAELYKDGTVGRHVKKSVKLYKERRDHFCGLLRDELKGRVAFKIPEGGMTVWTKFLDSRLSEVVHRAHKNGLIMNDGTDYDTGNIRYNSSGLGFASLDLREQEKVIAILKRSL
ncbi:MAG TPA: PLP-dependent aminotransferase family protein [Puia sp.]|jgi:GntR family transcriptional regulator/MocR family aminotransferase|nr:PLP-dependent aminotransferase family protein [Puia sp.]